MVFLTGLFALRYTWVLGWLIFAGGIIMKIAGENLQEIDDQKGDTNGH
jgi:hypothetical protein